ncbi:MAG: hypothetical protein ABIP54_04770, partial [Candidatus Andersenbacteria bacterium]
ENLKRDPLPSTITVNVAQEDVSTTKQQLQLLASKTGIKIFISEDSDIQNETFALNQTKKESFFSIENYYNTMNGFSLPYCPQSKK